MMNIDPITAAKVDGVKADVAALQATANAINAKTGIKSIQRGVMGGGTATITAVVPSKTELRYLGSNGQWSLGDASQSGGATARIALTNATTITAVFPGLNAISGQVSWELTEYF